MIEFCDTESHAAPATAREAESLPADEARGGFVDDVIAALRTVHDPEIPVNIYDLGLIYRIDAKGEGLVEIDMTLTAPGCPVANEMVTWVERAVSEVSGVAEVRVALVFDPPWDQSRMSDETKLELGLV